MERIAVEGSFAGGLRPEVTRALRMRVQALSAAPRENVIASLRSLDMRRQNGTGDYSIRLTDDCDLVVSFEDGEDERMAVVKALLEHDSE